MILHKDTENSRDGTNKQMGRLNEKKKVLKNNNTYTQYKDDAAEIL